MIGQSFSIRGRQQAESPPMFIGGKRQKNQKDKGLRILKMRVRELFTHGEGISTLHASHKGQQPLIECANHDFKIVYFSFFIFFMFFTFLGLTRMLPLLLHILGCDEEIRPTQFFKSKILCYIDFIVFWKIDLNCEQKLFKALDLETIS